MARLGPAVALALLSCLACLPVGAADTVPSPLSEVERAQVALPGAAASHHEPTLRTSVRETRGAHVQANVHVAVVVPLLPSLAAPAQGEAPSPLESERARAAMGALAMALLLAYWARLKSWLLTAAPFAFFTRIERGQVLDNAVRQRIHDAVSRTPGITLTEVAETCGVGWGTAVFHLGRLEHHGLVASERHRRRRRYFLAGTGLANGAKAAFAELLNPTSQRIAAKVLEQPGAAPKDVCTALGLLPPRAHKHLSALVRAALVHRERAERRVRYFPTPQLADLFRLIDPGPNKE